ncbi:serine/threonine protein phosphatase [Shewanella yunxiaonensis]|uniref:Serine/threonine protein phosphatase n=1 Tax=Shewanella yunxiaonensis TaxID=2829809 RepID=A0ABX7YX59_9GAMM|nr:MULTISPECIES: serine/threonine protein phosphatase [Shewanella]MDF0534283.1 serine/threonine protein phosphatase [Shewanella sp. A32]QUN07058.1 serine/threonine protein phosphatase [Shewanella yunxiaonensis]
MEQSLRERVQQVLNTHPGQRVCRFDYQGNYFWLKQAEILHGTQRVLKPNPQQALEHEKSTLLLLKNNSAPVPRIVDSGAGYFVVEDAGITLKDWLNSPLIDDEMLQQILEDSARALAGLHNMGFAHGRPALRDISWRQGQVTFIDFEAHHPEKSLLFQYMRDLVVYIHSLYRYLGPVNDKIARVIECYRNAGGEQIWQETKRFLASWQWLYYLLRPFRDIGGRDIRPVYWLLWHFRHA